ncbi:MAG: hypothetical protein FWH48_04365, partial [Oscillospiraceae bacterium]|nr:hypothetical protein [Oscillospiraceae bacterium]
ANEATMDGYGEHGVERYQWLAAEDERTCEICGALDGQKFKLKGLTKDENYGIINIPSGATIEELENFAKEKWSVDKIDITGLDPDAVGGTFEAMEQYPQLRNRIIEIRQYERAIMGVASNF